MSTQNQMSASVGAEADTNGKGFTSSPFPNYYNSIIPQKINNSTKNFKTFGDIFSQVKNALDIRQVIECYGTQLDSKGFASCPFHAEKSPSFKVYTDSFYCFGCMGSGTVIDFTMRCFGLTPIEAAKKLSADFNLDLVMADSHHYSSTAIEARRRNKKILADFDKPTSVKWL